MKKRKPTNSTVKTKNLSSSRQLRDYFVSGQSLLDNPGKDQWRERFIHTLVDWAQLDDSLEIMQFLISHKIPRTTLLTWANTHDDIKRALDEVKLILASRRRLLALHGKVDKTMVLRDLHRYDPEEDENNKYHAALKNNDSHDSGGIKVVVMEKFPSSDIVPDRKDNNE